MGVHDRLIQWITRWITITKRVGTFLYEREMDYHLDDHF